jgi:hypothetical protein
MQGHRMHKVHPRQLMPLALEKRPVTVRSGKVTIYRAGQDNLVFHDEESAEALDMFDGREKALLGFMAADQSCIHLFTNDEDLRYVASPRNIRRVDISDTDAILCRAGEVDRGRDRIRDEVADLLDPRETRYAAMRENNAAALGSALEEPEVKNRYEIGKVIQQAEDKARYSRKLKLKLRSDTRINLDDLIPPAVPEETFGNPQTTLDDLT